MSLRTRVLLLAGIFLTALLGIGWVWHSTMQQLYQQADELSQRSARCELLGTPLDDEQRDMAKMARASGEALL